MQKISEAIVAGSLEAISEKEKADMEAQRDKLIAVGGRAVEPYIPNRKQRRAQQAKLRDKRRKS